MGDSSNGRRVHDYPPQQVVELLRRADTETDSPPLARVLECFRHRWLRWVRSRHPRLQAQHEDLVQEAQILVLRCVDQVRDPARIEAWANQVFRSVVREALTKTGRRRRWEHEVPPSGDPDERLGEQPDPGPGPEGNVAHAEGRHIVREIVRLDAVAWRKFQEEQTDQEIKEATGLSRDAIATRCKRIRTVLRRLLDDTDEQGRPLPAATIVEGTGLSGELREKIILVIERLRKRGGGRA